MRCSIRYGTFLLFLTIFLPIFAQKRRAFFSKPVVDLISRDLGCYCGFERFINTYAPESKNSCLRTFQGLFGERVLVTNDIPSSDGYVCVEMTHCIFADNARGKQSLYYWARRDDLIFEDELLLHERAYFPQPISHEDESSVDVEGVVTLAKPWTCAQTGVTYSVGTRFISHSCSAPGRHKTIIFFEPHKKILIVAEVPKRLLVNHGDHLPLHEKRKAFVKLLREWSKNRDGVIPYVWGGASCISRATDENFSVMTDIVDGQKVSYWQHGDVKSDPDGFDCSALVLRAAQACGIPYFCRTACTASAILAPFVAGDTVSRGDLFVTAGHNHIFVAIGGDMIVEAAGYTSGFACVHAIKVKDRFLNAKNYDDLVRLFDEGRVPIYRCRDGKNIFPTKFFIVKLPVPTVD